MTSPFDNLTGHGKPLKAEPADARDLAGLCRSGLARLEDAANAGLSLEGRFDLAYNAAHALSLTLGLGPEVWRVLAKCHELRNLSEYEGVLDIDERLVADLITACQAVAAKLTALSA